MALTDFFDACVLLDKRTASDGFGGVVETWTDGAEIRLGITRVSSTEARIAYQSGTREMFTLVMLPTLTLGQNDRVKRIKDGKVFRVTSDSRNMTTPEAAQMQFRQCDAEVIALDGRT